MKNQNKKIKKLTKVEDLYRLKVENMCVWIWHILKTIKVLMAVELEVKAV